MATIPSVGGRDRDPDGRARNARPRDELGRPLPYGSPAVPRQLEGIRRTPQQTIAEAQRLLDAGRPFHAHEVFEDAWKLDPSPERELWKGLAQLAVGLTHLARGNVSGARTLVSRGAAAVQRFDHPAAPGGEQSESFGLDITALVRWSAAFTAALDVPGAEPPMFPRLSR